MLEQRLRKATHDVEVARIDLFLIWRRAREKITLVVETRKTISRQLEAKNAAHHRLITPLLKYYTIYREDMNMYYWGSQVLRRKKRLEACIRRLERLQPVKQNTEPWKLRIGPLGEVSVLWIWGIITSHLIIPYCSFGWKGVVLLFTFEVGYVLVTRLLKRAKYVG